jgi:hypothetical protein
VNEPRLLLALAALAVTGCVSTDPAVFVDPTIESPSAAVSGGALGATVTGAFTLTLHLGPRASGPSTVALGAFSILDAGKSAAITAVQLAPGTPSFPVTVDLDSDVTAKLSFDLGGKTLPTDAKTKLCDPAGVLIGGAIQDSLAGGSTPVFSAVLHPTGCM